MRSKGKAMVVTLSDDEISDHESGSDENGNFITFRAITIIHKSVVVDENLSDGELSESADLQETYNKLCKVVAKDAMSIDLGLKKIASLEFDKKNLLLKLFDANELINKVRTKNILLLDKVKNLELKLFVAREKKKYVCESSIYIQNTLKRLDPKFTKYQFKLNDKQLICRL